MRRNLAIGLPGLLVILAAIIFWRNWSTEGSSPAETAQRLARTEEVASAPEKDSDPGEASDQQGASEGGRLGADDAPAVEQDDAAKASAKPSESRRRQQNMRRGPSERNEEDEAPTPAQTGESRGNRRTKP